MNEQNFYNYNYDNNQSDNYQPEPQPPRTSRGLAIAALVLGIISLVGGCCLFYITFALGALAIILAVLSKGDSPEMSGQAKAGMGLGIAGMAFSIICIVALLSFYGITELQNTLRDYSDYYYYDDSYRDDSDSWFYNAPDEQPSRNTPKYDLEDSL